MDLGRCPPPGAGEEVDRTSSLDPDQLQSTRRSDRRSDRRSSAAGTLGRAASSSLSADGAEAKKKKKKEKKHKTHPHLADLTHLSATKFVKFTAEPGQLCSPYEMSSFGEKKALKLLRLKQKDDDGDDAAADDDGAPPPPSAMVVGELRCRAALRAASRRAGCC